MTIKGFEHFVGKHCSSSAIKSALAFDGINLSEAMIFGLASGLGFFYLHDSELPSRKFNGRAPDLEGNFYKLIGQELDWAKVWDFDIIEKTLDNNRPIIAQTDIYSIPYYDDVHFIGHGLLVLGHENDNLIVADIASADLLELPLVSFKKAISEDNYPLLKAYSYAPLPFVKSIDIEALLPTAIKKTCWYMLEPPSKQEGLKGLQLMAEDIVNWPKQKDAAFIARFGYQAIEKRGTGGGSFRLIYSEFLEETSSFRKIDSSIVNGFKDSAQLWTAFARQLKNAAFADNKQQSKILSQSVQVLNSIVELEKQLFLELLENC